ncbi:hypothetical protein Hanom_Chr01g00038431 [Helianthus anomalus]
MQKRTHHVLWRLLIFLKGFIPSELSLHRMFLISLPNSGYLILIVLHWGEFATCLHLPSFIRSSECQRNNFASFSFANNRFSLGIIGRYHNILAGGPFLVTSSSTSSVSLLCLYLDAVHL